MALKIVGVNGAIQTQTRARHIEGAIFVKGEALGSFKREKEIPPQCETVPPKATLASSTQRGKGIRGRRGRSFCVELALSPFRGRGLSVGARATTGARAVTVTGGVRSEVGGLGARLAVLWGPFRLGGHGGADPYF